jgi:hypothetical protein
MRARTPRACGTAGVSLSAAGAACAGLRPSRVLSLPRPSGAALSAAFVERNAAKSGGRRLWFAAPERLPVGKSWRRQCERAGRSRPTFSASVESGRGGEPLATWGFESRRLSAQLSWHTRGTIIMARGSIGSPAQHGLQPTALRAGPTSRPCEGSDYSSESLSPSSRGG